MKLATRRTFVVGIFAVLTGCTDSPTSPKLAPSEAELTKRGGGSASGTTLSATKTATGYNEKRLDYDWSMSKIVKDIMDEKPGLGMYSIGSTTDVLIPRQEVRWIDYEISVQRNAGTMRQMSGVRGRICVTNGGAVPTSDLRIVDVVQMKRGGQFEDYQSSNVDLSAKPVLAAGETFCYPYDVAFTPQASSKYRNTARITITNHSGHLGTPFGPAFNGDGVKADFSIPTSVTHGPPIDAEAMIVDGLNVNNQGSRTGPCAEHFYMYWCTTNTEQLVWHVTGTTTFMFMVDLHNFFGCNDSFDFKNTATLTEGGRSGGTGRQTSASASLHIRSDACSPDPGCVLTQGYWKDPTHLWPDETPTFSWVRNAVEFFDAGKTWQQMLASTGTDAYAQLARQYITANLNRASGAALPGNVRQAFEATAHYLSLTPEQRMLVSASTLAGWTSVLSSYNAGNAGVAACSE